MLARGLPFLAIAVLLGAGGPRAATLDAEAQGDDVVFTWDMGAPDDILRGPTPDALVPWMTAVSSPLRVVGENALRGEDAFYRLASGSNMAFRIEMTFPADASPCSWMSRGVSLPLRRVDQRASNLFARWPALVNVTWFDPVDQREEALSRVGAALVGDDEALPPSGAVHLAFDGPATVTIVGSHDDATAGVLLSDLPLGTIRTPDGCLMAVPPHSRRMTAVELLCGTAGTDWQDANGDGYPDQCGTDLDADGLSDTGWWHGGRRPDGRESVLQLIEAWRAPGDQISVSYFFGRESMIGRDFRLEPGDAVQCAFVPAFDPPLQPAYAVPTW